MEADGNQNLGRKRKQLSATHGRPIISELLQDVGLEMLSEDEEEEQPVPEGDSDDGEVEEFPEIDASSSEEDEEAEDEEEEDDEESSDETDDDISPFPKPKTIISDITGKPKRVYPEIEADYDSDSSTEEVSMP